MAGPTISRTASRPPPAMLSGIIPMRRRSRRPSPLAAQGQARVRPPGDVPTDRTYHMFDSAVPAPLCRGRRDPTSSRRSLVPRTGRREDWSPRRRRAKRLNPTSRSPRRLSISLGRETKRPPGPPARGCIWPWIIRTVAILEVDCLDLGDDRAGPSPRNEATTVKTASLSRRRSGCPNARGPGRAVRLQVDADQLGPAKSRR